MATCPKCGSNDPKLRLCIVNHDLFPDQPNCDNSDFHDPVSEPPATATPVGTCNRIDEERHKGSHFKIYDTNQSGPPFPCLNFVVASGLPVEAPSQCQITVQDVVWLVRHKLTVGPVLLPAFRECARERITECLDALQQIQQDGWKRSSWVDSTRASVVEAPTHCGQRDRDAELLRVVDDPEIIYYGPHACETCQRIICRVSLEQGGMKFDYPHGIIYPNTNWVQHVCPDLTVTERPVVEAPREATPEPSVSQLCAELVHELKLLTPSEWLASLDYPVDKDFPSHIVPTLMKQYADYRLGPIVERTRTVPSFVARAAASTPPTTPDEQNMIDTLISEIGEHYQFDEDTNTSILEGALHSMWAAASSTPPTTQIISPCVKCGRETPCPNFPNCTPPTTLEYPKPCGICNGVIESKDDLDWHGYGNCRDIPDIVMADLNIAELLRDLQGHVAGELGERLDKAVNGLAAPNAPSHNAGEN